MRRWLVAVAVVGLIAAACGTEPGPAGSPPPADRAACEEGLGALLSALGELDSRLSVGMVFGEYGDRLGDARVAYDAFDPIDLETRCVSEIGIPAEQALNRYAEAHEIWNDCIRDFDCSLDSVEPKLQEKWAEASDLLDEARTALRSFG